MPIYSPTGFLDITNATLRTSNVEAENLLMTGGNIYVTSELETDATVLNLENVTRKGNVSSNTIHITDATTGIIATGNVEAAKFIGSGSHLTGIPPSAITGTLSQWSDGNNNDVYIASNVGIANAHTLTSNTLQVGGNLYVRDTGSNVLTVNGNVVANYFEGDGSKLSGIVTDLQGVTDNGNTTTNVVQFSNATTGLVTTANIEVGGDLKIDGLTAGKVPYVAADKFLKDSFITTTGDATVISSNLDVTGNIFMRGNKFIVESETKLINDAIIGIANNNTSSTTDKGIIMQNTTGNVAIIHHGTGDGFADQLTFGYTADPLDTVTVTNDLTKELTVNVLGNVITQNNLSIGGLLKINTISAASSHSLQAVTNLGNVTSNTVQFSNAITSLVASSNIVATGNVSAGYDTNTTSYFGKAAVGHMGTSGQASFAHVSHNDPARYAIKQTAAGPTYINTPASGHIRFTVNDGNSGAEKMRITSAGKVGIGVGAPDATLHVVGNAYVSSNLTVNDNVTITKKLDYGISPDRIQQHVTGGGKVFFGNPIQGSTPDYYFGNTITLDGTESTPAGPPDYLKWDQRVIPINFDLDNMYTAGGYVDINCPTSGTIDFINSSGTTQALTCTENGIPFARGEWLALYYRWNPNGVEGTTMAASGNDRGLVLVDYRYLPTNRTSKWILLAIVNSDVSSCKWLPGCTHIPRNMTYSASHPLLTYPYVFRDCQEIGDLALGVGWYWFRDHNMTHPDYTYFGSDYWALAFSSKTYGNASFDMLNKGVGWDYLRVQSKDGAHMNRVWFASKQDYATRTSTSTSSAKGGYLTGMRVFLGGAGQHGIYATAQAPCNWNIATNAIGAGWDGVNCGTYPNNLVWGTGQSNSAVYTNITSGEVWEIWIYFHN